MAATICPNPKCKAHVPPDKPKCQKCGFPLPKRQAPGLIDEVTSRPWLMALLAGSVMMTLWAATRRPAPPPPSAEPEPVAEAPAPAPQSEPDNAPLPMPSIPLPAASAPAAASAETRPAPRLESEPLVARPDGSWSGGPAVKRPEGAR